MLDRTATAIRVVRSLLEQRKESFVKSWNGDANSVVKSGSSGANSNVETRMVKEVKPNEGILFSCCFSVYIIFLYIY